jgi:hypothetical protein
LNKWNTTSKLESPGLNSCRWGGTRISNDQIYANWETYGKTKLVLKLILMLFLTLVKSAANNAILNENRATISKSQTLLTHERISAYLESESQNY